MKNHTIETLLSEIEERFGEHLDMKQGNEKSVFYSILVSKMLIDERNKVEYLQERLKEYEYQSLLRRVV